MLMLPMRNRSEARKINAYVIGFVIWAGLMYALSTASSALFWIGLGASMILAALLLPQ